MNDIVQISKQTVLQLVMHVVCVACVEWLECIASGVKRRTCQHSYRTHRPWSFCWCCHQGLLSHVDDVSIIL